MISFIREKLRIVLGDQHLMDILRRSGIAFGLSFVGYVLMYVFFVLVGRWYGTEGLGVFGLIQTGTQIAMYLALLGMGTLIVRRVGEIRGSDQYDQIPGIIYAMAKIILPVSCLFALLAFVLGPVLSEVFFSTRDPAYVSLIRFAGFCVPFACLGYMIIQYFRGMSQTFRAEGIRVAIPLIWVVSLCILFVLGATSVLESGRVFIISQYLIGVVGLGLFVWVVYGFSHRSKKSTHIRMSELLDMGLPMLVTSFGYLIMTYMDVVMIGIFLPTSDVGVYSAALRAAMVMGIPLNIFGAIASSEIARLRKRSDTRGLSRTLRLVSGLLVVMVVPIFVICFFFPSFVLGLFGSDFVSGALALQILAIGYLIHVWSGNNSVYMEMVGYEKVLRNIILVTALLNVTLNALLVPVIGIYGAAVATSTSLVVWNLITNWYIRRRDGLRTYFWWK